MVHELSNSDVRAKLITVEIVCEMLVFTRKFNLLVKFTVCMDELHGIFC
jgi:hypothetical protein